MNYRPVEPSASNEELSRKIETHLRLDEGSPGFLLNRADFERIVCALRPDREAMALAGLNELKRRYPQDLAFANSGFTLGVVRAVLDGAIGSRKR